MAGYTNYSSSIICILIVATAFALLPISSSVPFILIHGIGDQCSNRGVKRLTQQLSDWSNSEGYCIEIGNGSWDSWFMALEEQVEIVCDKVKKIKELKQGFNVVGLSQGNLIGRGLVEFCEGAPPVKNFISLAGPHAGTASVPLCGSGIFCILADKLIKSEVYSDLIQEHLAPSGYLKLPNNIPAYLESCRFLPKVNNELPDKRNSTYKERFSGLQNLVLIMFKHDTVLIPKETSWFGYYPDGAFDPVLPPQQTQLYIEDWIGLKTLDDAGKVQYISVPGKHLGISKSDAQKYIVPYLEDEASVKDSTGRHTYSRVRGVHHGVSQSRTEMQIVNHTEGDASAEMMLDGSSSYSWPASVTSFFDELLGFANDESSPRVVQ
ncbi:Palmitoyl-protein thioesterase 1 [Camellia lanceoleosa]|uniref:Palmitoyl-protein thioesterase 1 n=1 Tax=Camellia lanceoleosa TaxID=1840588 RepID=A0ACC0FHX4_9ERIC|nr:Palmitoyl-protein thioesterase 1 [Camellia lanceoleosa]